MASRWSGFCYFRGRHAVSGLPRGCGWNERRSTLARGHPARHSHLAARPALVQRADVAGSLFQSLLFAGRIVVVRLFRYEELPDVDTKCWEISAHPLDNLGPKRFRRRSESERTVARF